MPFGVTYYLWLPTKNHAAPTPEQLCIGVANLHHFERIGIKTFVHCERGHGRAPTLVAAFLVTKGMSVDEAIKFVKKRRPVAHPNKKQTGAIKKWAAMWKSGKCLKHWA